MPYLSRYQNYVEIFNEMAICSCSYLLYMCTDLITMKEEQYRIGWGVVLILLFTILANLISISITNVIMVCKKLCKRKKIKKVDMDVDGANSVSE